MPIKVITDRAVTSFTVTGLASNTTYYFTVRAYNTDGYYSDSEQTSGKTLEEVVAPPEEKVPLPIYLIIVPIVVITVVTVVAVIAFGIRRGKKGAMPPEKVT